MLNTAWGVSEMREATRQKIERIKIAIQEGKTEPEIRKAAKSKSIADHEAFIEKYHDLIFGEKQSEQLEILEEGQLEEIPQVGNPIMNIFRGKEDLEALRSLLDNHKDLLSLLQAGREDRDSYQSTEYLEVPEELRKIEDLKLKSHRISRKLESDLDDIVKRHGYTKTSLLNMAIYEFVKRYK